MERKFYNELMDWKNRNMLKPLMVLGARQVGKTYIISKFCKNEFKEYVYINLLENKNIIDIFENNMSFAEKVKKLELELNEKITNENNDKIIFIDEIQESEALISDLKAFAESEEKYNIIAAGSLLGVKINRFKSSFPVGKVEIKQMFPMDFEEYLLAINKKMWVDEIKEAYSEMRNTSIHEKLINEYRTYLCIGGMPESIKNYVQVGEDILKYDKNINKNIVMAYIADMKKYVTSASEAVKIEEVYKNIPVILGKENKKFIYSDISEKGNKRYYESAINWLLSSNIIYKCNKIKKVEIPLKAYADENSFKLYLNDTGLLNSLLEINFNDILLDKEFIYKGAIAENYIASSLKINNNSLYYWNSGNKAELDFVIYNDDGIIPLEVKAGKNTASKSLNSYIEKYKPKYSIRLSTKNFGFKNGIKSIPLYAAFLIFK